MVMIPVAKKCLHLLQWSIWLLTFTVLLMLLMYSGIFVFELSLKVLDHSVIAILHDIAFFVVLLKAYKVLYSYLEHGSVAIKYIVEISIVAPLIEVIFAFDKHPFFISIFLGIFGLAALIIYSLLFDRISRMRVYNKHR
jgi:uncharacterized membrane protein (DUF373 family)